jgi:hypothetical protein
MIEVYVDSETNALQKALKATEAQIAAANELTAKDLERRALQLFKGTVKNWKHDVEFVSDIDFGPDGVTIIAGTDDQVYFYLDRGTQVRRAVMSLDWQSKTRPGSLQSGPGRGRVVFISKKISLPGIKARNFSGNITATIERELEPTFNKNIKKTVRL